MLTAIKLFAKPDTLDLALPALPNFKGVAPALALELGALAPRLAAIAAHQAQEKTYHPPQAQDQYGLNTPPRCVNAKAC